MKYVKQCNEKRMRMMGTAVASLMNTNAQNTQTVHMTTLPMIRTARGSNIMTVDTPRDNTMALTGPTVSESQGSDYQAWTN